MAKPFEPQQVTTKTSEQEKIAPLVGKFSFNLYAPTLDPSFGPTLSGDAHADMLAYRFHYYNDIKDSQLLMKGRDKSKVIIWSFPAKPSIVSTSWEQGEPHERIWNYKDEGKRMMVSGKTYDGQMSTAVSYDPPWPLFIRRRSMNYFPVGRPLDPIASEEYAKDTYAAMTMALPRYYLYLAVASAVGNSAELLEKLQLEATIRQMQQKMLANSDNQFKSDNQNACGGAGALGAGLIKDGLKGKIDGKALEQAVQNFMACMQKVAQNGEITIYVSGVAAQETYVIGGKTYTPEELNRLGGEEIGKVVSRASGIKKVHVVLRLDINSSDEQKAKDFSDLATELDNISNGKNMYSQTLRQWAEQCRNGQMSEKLFNQVMIDISRRSREDAQVAQARGIFEGILFSLPGASFNEMYKIDGDQTQVKVENNEVHVGMRLIAGPYNSQLGMTWPESEVLEKAIGASANLDLTSVAPTKNLLNITPAGDGTYYIDRIVHLPSDGLRYAGMMPYGFMGGEAGTALAFEFGGIRPYVEITKADIAKRDGKRRQEKLSTIPTQRKTEPWADYSIMAGGGYGGGNAYYDKSRSGSFVSKAENDAVRSLLDKDIRVQRYEFDRYLRSAFDRSTLSVEGRLEHFGPLGLFAEVKAGHVHNPNMEYGSANATWYNTQAQFVKGAVGISQKLFDDVRASVGGDLTYASMDPVSGKFKSSAPGSYLLFGSFDLSGAPGRIELSNEITKHTNAMVSNVNVEVRANKDWLNLGIRTDWNTAQLFGSTANELTPLGNWNKLRIGNKPIETITSSADMTLRLLSFGATQLQIGGRGVLDWSSRLPVEAGVKLEYNIGSKLGNHLSMYAGQDWIYNGGAGYTRFDSRVLAGASAKFWDYFNAGVQWSQTTGGWEAWYPKGDLKTNSLSVYAGISIPITTGSFGGGKMVVEMPPTYEQNIEPITPPANLKPVPIATPISSGTIKAADGSEIKVKMVEETPAPQAPAPTQQTTTRPKKKTEEPEQKQTEAKITVEAEEEPEQIILRQVKTLFEQRQESILQKQKKKEDEKIETPAASKNEAPAQQTTTRPKKKTEEPEQKQAETKRTDEPKQKPDPATQKQEPVQPTTEPVPQIKTLFEQQQESIAEKQKKNEVKIETPAVSKNEAPAAKTEEPGSNITFRSGGITQATSAPIESVEDEARYRKNKKTDAGELIEERLKTLASSINESAFGNEYRTRFGINIVDENRVAAIEHMILGGGAEEGVSFYKIYSPNYNKDAQTYVDGFLTPMHSYLKSIGIEAQAMVEEIKMGGETIGVQVRLVLPQSETAIDRALNQKR